MDNNSMLHHWCRFVLEEGIVPPVIIRKLNAVDSDLSENGALLAKILKERENFKCPQELANLGDVEAAARAAFLGDPELTSWLDEAGMLLDIISVYGRGDSRLSSTGDVVDGACKSFIKSCYLVAATQKDKYLGLPQTPILFRSLSDDERQQQAFAHYLQYDSPKKYAANSATSYVSYLNSLLRQSGVNVNVWEIDNPQTLKELSQHLRAKGNAQSRYWIALERYMDFLIFKNSGA